MSSESPAVVLESVSKWYGDVIGVNDVSLAIDGGVTGVIDHGQTTWDDSRGGYRPCRACS